MSLIKLVTTCAVLCLVLPTANAQYGRDRFQQQLQRKNFAKDGLTLNQLYQAAQNEAALMNAAENTDLQKMREQYELQNLWQPQGSYNRRWSPYEGRYVYDLDPYARPHHWDPYGHHWSPHHRLPRWASDRREEYDEFSRRKSFVKESPYGFDSYGFDTHAWSESYSYGPYGTYRHRSFGFNPNSPTLFQGLQQLAGTIGNYVQSKFRSAPEVPPTAVNTQLVQMTQAAPVSNIIAPMNLQNVPQMQQQTLAMPSLQDLRFISPAMRKLPYDPIPRLNPAAHQQPKQPQQLMALANQPIQVYMI